MVVGTVYLLQKDQSMLQIDVHSGGDSVLSGCEPTLTEIPCSLIVLETPRAVSSLRSLYFQPILSHFTDWYISS